MTVTHLRHHPAKRLSENVRVEVIGKLNDRRHECHANGNALGLLELAADYDALKYMHRTAAIIRIEAAEMEKR